MTTVGDIERELVELREASTEPGAAPRLRTSVMTHIAWVPEDWVEAATGTLAGLAERHPSRTILLFPRPEDDVDELEGEVDYRCFVRGGLEREVCSEVITLRLRGRRATAPASVVVPLLVSDLPAFLRWRGPLPYGAPELEQLVGVADRLVVDSREWPDPPAALARLPSLFDRIAVSDIAWARTLPWRAAVADLWPDVRDAAAVREVAVGGVDDGVDRLVEQVALHHLENAPPGAAGGYFFLREDLRLRGTFAPARRAWDRPIAIACLRTLREAFFPYCLAIRTSYSTFAFALSPRTSSSIFVCTSICWMRCLTSASVANLAGRTSSS